MSGGTFTDLVAIDSDGATTFTKSASTPQDQSIGVIDGLRDLAQRLDLSLDVLLDRTQRIVHGTTVATNALLERKGAKVGLLTTAGHRDVLEMREGLKPDRYNLVIAPPEPLVPRDLRRGVTERIAFDGSIVTPLDETSVIRELEFLKAQGVSSVAICYLHSYRNDAHERRTAELVAEHLPDAYVSLSSDVLPQIKEFERVSTTVVNSYVGLAVKNYLGKLRQRLADVGLSKDILFVILSHGGIALVEEAARLAAGTCLSGPAGGIAGAKACAELFGAGDVIPFDMGGTSTEISLISDNDVALTSQRGLAGERIALRSFDILSIGAGGGSLARLDATNTFVVGPQSAGAFPGPACYGHGGSEPTVTDANLLLGYLDADNFLGGRSQLDIEASERVTDAFAERLGLDRIQTAAGIHRLINVKMADGIRLMTLRRGVDPRRFTLVSFGGAAGLHAAEVAREMEISRVLVPTVASVLSAWGMLASDLRYEVSRSHVGDTTILNDEALRTLYGELEAEARQRLPPSIATSMRIERSAELRYGEQIFEVDVSLDGLDLTMDNLADAVVDRFHRRHEELYTYASPGQEVDLVNARVAVIGEVPRGFGVSELAPATGAGGGDPQ
jgi:N-methylhydantoinase A